MVPDPTTLKEKYHIVAIREVPGRGMCAIEEGVVTFMLRYGVQFSDPYAAYSTGIYFFEDWIAALSALVGWDGTGDPPGDWVKHKGGMREYGNPNHSDPRKRPFKFKTPKHPL